MKARYLVLFMALSPWIDLQAQPAPVESAVAEVFLAPDAAVVVRHFDLAGQAGENRFVLPGLPAGLQPDSLQVTADPAIRAELESVDLRLSDQRQVTDSERVRELKARLAKAERALAELDAERAAVKLRLEALEGLARGLGPAVPENAQLQGLEWLEEIEIRALALHTRLAEGRMQRAEQNERIEALRQQIDQIEARAAGGRSVVLSIRARAAFSGQFALSYRHAGAGWTPAYKADLDADTGLVTWSTRARVRQQTGEDWEDISLSIGMNDRRSWRPVPELRSWEIGLQDPAVLRRADGAPGPEVAMLAQSPLPSGGATLEGSRYALEYVVDQPVTLGSGTDEQLLTLDEWTGEAQVVSWTMPRQSPVAVLVGDLRFEGAATLPAGDLILYRDGRQVGRTRSDELIPGQDLRLSFGIDPGIDVEYRDAPEQRDERGLIGRHKKIERNARVMVTNHHDRPAAVRVFDRLPVPLDADISVQPSAKNTPPSERNAEGHEGVMAWDLALEPDASGQIRFGYTVSWPADKQLDGLMP
ncbi:MAG: mucoidy inhibitor MuiA family protein [Halothiobacillaceae bacterium]